MSDADDPQGISLIASVELSKPDPHGQKTSFGRISRERRRAMRSSSWGDGVVMPGALVPRRWSHDAVRIPENSCQL